MSHTKAKSCKLAGFVCFLDTFLPLPSQQTSQKNWWLNFFSAFAWLVRRQNFFLFLSLGHSKLFFFFPVQFNRFALAGWDQRKWTRKTWNLNFLWRKFYFCTTFRRFFKSFSRKNCWNWKNINFCSFFLENLLKIEKKMKFAGKNFNFQVVSKKSSKNLKYFHDFD